MTYSPHSGRVAAGLVLALILLFPFPTASAEDAAPGERVVTARVLGEEVTFLEFDRPHGTVAFQLPAEGREGLPAWRSDFADRMLGRKGIAETTIREWLDTERRAEEEYRTRRKAAETREEKQAAERWRFAYLDPDFRRAADRFAKRGDGEEAGLLPAEILRPVRIEVYWDREFAKRVAEVREDGRFPLAVYLPDRKLVAAQAWSLLEKQVSFTGRALAYHLMNAYLARAVERDHPVLCAFGIYLSIRSLDPDLLCLLGRDNVEMPGAPPHEIDEFFLGRPGWFDQGTFSERLALFLRYLRERDETNLPRLLTGLAGNLKGASPAWSPVTCRSLVETATGEKLEDCVHDFRIWSRKTFERDRERALASFHRLWSKIHY